MRSQLKWLLPHTNTADRCTVQKIGGLNSQLQGRAWHYLRKLPAACPGRHWHILRPLSIQQLAMHGVPHQIGMREVAYRHWHRPMRRHALLYRCRPVGTRTALPPHDQIIYFERAMAVIQWLDSSQAS